MNNIVFGQYVPGNSWLYRLDPRTKVILAIFLIITLFILPNLLSILIAFGVFTLIFLSSGVSVMRVIKGLRPIIFLLVFTFILQLVYNTTGELLYTFKMQFGLFQLLILLGMLLFYLFTKKYLPFKLLYFLIFLVGGFLVLWYSRFDYQVWTNFDFVVYEGGVESALFIFIRILIMLFITSMLTVSTMSMDINNGLEWLLSPLKVFKVPVSVFSMGMCLTLRFVPTLYEEARKIMNAQASRGVDFQEGKFKDKVTQVISLLIPMFVISFHRAEDLSNAMEARGYVIGAPRTRLDVMKFKVLDYFCFFVSLVFFGLAIWSNFYG